MLLFFVVVLRDRETFSFFVFNARACLFFCFYFWSWGAVNERKKEKNAFFFGRGFFRSLTLLYSRSLSDDLIINVDKFFSQNAFFVDRFGIVDFLYFHSFLQCLKEKRKSAGKEASTIRKKKQFR